MSFKGFRLNGRIIGEIYKVGVPSIVMQAIGSVMNIGMNKHLDVVYGGSGQRIWRIF